LYSTDPYRWTLFRLNYIEHSPLILTNLNLLSISMGYGGYVSVQKSKILSLLQFFHAQGNFILNLVPIRTLWHYGQIAHFIILRRTWNQMLTRLQNADCVVTLCRTCIGKLCITQIAHFIILLGHGTKCEHGCRSCTGAGMSSTCTCGFSACLCSSSS
jgi:hypothetical protein